ncbi:hypothetical protein ACI2OX_04590 [Bacillus sp. N9]
MEESGIKEILNALELHSAQIDQKLDQVESRLENRMDQRFDRLEVKIDHLRTDLTEVQETVDLLSMFNTKERSVKSIINKHNPLFNT